jgi:hypothetical protein
MRHAHSLFSFSASACSVFAIPCAAFLRHVAVWPPMGDASNSDYPVSLIRFSNVNRAEGGASALCGDAQKF